MGAEPKRHFYIGDTQTRPGVPLDHIDWIARAIVEYKPDVVVHLGDHWDFPSLSGHEEPGSVPLENKRYADDLHVGNESFARLSIPIENEIARLKRNHDKRWEPRLVFHDGNHENRADRVAQSDAKFEGTIGSFQCDTRGWERYPFLKGVEIDGIWSKHFFPNQHSGKPIGGEVPNRLTKIGASFVAGHEQGKREGNKIMATGRTLYGLVLGSAYLHIEPYRGNGAQRHWRGCAVLNEVEAGEYDLMTLSLKYLCRKNTGELLSEYMARRYPNGDWSHLA